MTATMTEDGRRMFSGEELFALKATHGLPLGFALDRIINEEGMAVDWVAFIEAARRNEWWDFQTYEMLCSGMEDAGMPREIQAAIRARFQLYVVAHPHQNLVSAKASPQAKVGA